MKDIKVHFLLPILRSGFIHLIFLQIFSQAVVEGQSGIAQSNLHVQAEELVDSFFATHNLPGISLVAAGGDSIIFRYDKGFAHLNDSTPIQSCCSLFRVGSVVKPMTATMMMQLVEEGKLDADMDVNAYLMDEALPWQSITARQLATHTAGIRHYRGLEYMIAEPYSSIGDGLEIFIADSLLGEPGERYHYSSYGYNLLGRVLERIDGKSFENMLKERILTPAGMVRSIAEYPEITQDGRVSFYLHNDKNELIGGPFVHNYYKLPSGGLLSTTEDLARFGMSLLEEALISRENLEESLQPTPLPNGEESFYGLGWTVSDPTKEGKRYFLHGGGSVGGSTMLLIFPDEPFILTIATNCSMVPLQDLSFILSRHFIGE